MALDSGNWQCLPEVGNGCQRLASVAALPNSLPEIGDRRRELKSSASLWQAPPARGGGLQSLATAARRPPAGRASAPPAPSPQFVPPRRRAVDRGDWTLLERVWTRPALTTTALEARPLAEAANQLLDVARGATVAAHGARSRAGARGRAPPSPPDAAAAGTHRSAAESPAVGPRSVLRKEMICQRRASGRRDQAGMPLRKLPLVKNQNRSPGGAACTRSESSGGPGWPPSASAP
jgi:hypothetical protein